MSTEYEGSKHPETPEGYERLHKGLMIVASFFFIYLVIEALVMMPYFIINYGWF
jgi:hypothetical protein